VNTEGRVQAASRAAFPPGDAREDWAILRALSGALGGPLPFDSLTQLRKAMFEKHPHLQRLDAIELGDAASVSKLTQHSSVAMNDAFVSSVSDFYLTNPIARASAVMAECSALAKDRLRQAAE
jgi:NADH-quinone oxidoreductase subunit G